MEVLRDVPVCYLKRIQLEERMRQPRLKYTALSFWLLTPKASTGYSGAEEHRPTAVEAAAVVVAGQVFGSMIRHQIEASRGAWLGLLLFEHHTPPDRGSCRRIQESLHLSVAIPARLAGSSLFSQRYSAATPGSFAPEAPASTCRCPAGPRSSISSTGVRNRLGNHLDLPHGRPCRGDLAPMALQRGFGREST